MKEHQEQNQASPHVGKAPDSRRAGPLPKNREAGENPERIRITYYTDPLCCWSWAFEPHWRKLLGDFDGMIDYRYVMCGMIPDWQSYNDPMNSVSKPIQMGPVWMHASEVTQVKMKHSIWFEDPPVSSYPSCIAVKTAGLQSEAAADELLSLVRKELMEDGKNVSRAEVLFDIAKKLKALNFDIGRFESDWNAKNGIDAFREDIMKARFHNIGRYPTLTFTNSNGKGIMITGYRPYQVLHEAFLFAQAELIR